MSEGHWYGRRAATWAITERTIDPPKFSTATDAWNEWKLALRNLKNGIETERNAAQLSV